MSPALSAGGWRVAPLVVVKEAAVAVEVGEVLGAGIAVVLIGPVWAMCGRLRAVKGLSTSQRWSEQPCVRPSDAAHRPLAIMPSADQVPVTGSTDLHYVLSALSSHHTASPDAISLLVALPYRASAMGSL